MYKLGPILQPNQKSIFVKRLIDNAFIPFDPANRDYEQFKVDAANGVELQDSDGNVMTKDQVNAFLKEIP